MSMRLWINGNEITTFSLSSINYSTPFKDTIDEELDQLNIQVKSTTRQSFKKFDKLVYWIGHGSTVALNKRMAIFDVVESWKGEKWVYQITCLSPTKILENIIINGMAETYNDGNMTLYKQMARVQRKINAQLSVEMDVYPEIIFNSTIADSGDDSVIKNVFGSSDFLWDGQVNVREIFNDMLDKADAICVATNYSIDANNNVTQIEVGAVKREKVGREIVNSVYDVENGGLNSVKQVVKGITYNRNSEFACGNIISLTKNAIARDNVQQAYLPARNMDLTIDDASKWCIVTQEPIYSLDEDLGCKVTAIVPSEVTQSTYVSNVINGEPVTSAITSTLYYGREIDITDYIVEKSVFDTMDVTEQSKHLYFKRGEKGIYNLFSLYKTNPLYSVPAFVNIINDIGNIGGYPFELIKEGVVKLNPLLKWDNSNNKWTTNYDYTIKNGSWQIGDFYDLNVMNDSTLNTNKAKYSLFSIKYQPYCDSVVKIEKTTMTNLEANTKNLSVLKNQSDRTIDASKYYDSQQALINRMGNKEMFLDAMIDVSGQYNSTLTLWDLGDFFTLNYKKWTITQREIENYNMGKLKVRYTLSKEYNASNIDIQVNRDKRLYGIPLSQYVDRYIIIKNQNANNIDKLAIESWDDFTLPHDALATYQKGFNILEMIKIGNSSITDRVARCYDNFAVDIERTKYNSTIVNVYTRYCDEDGYKTTINLYGLTNTLYNSLACSDYSRLPFKPYADGGATIEASGYKMQLTNITKDKMERLIFIIKN